jgi:hypothetical protein
MGRIKDIFIKLISNSKNRLLLAGASVILLLFLLNRWNYTRLKQAEEKVARMELNLQAAQDTIRITKAKNGELEYNRKIYVVEKEKELKALSASLAKQVALTKGDVSIIQSVGFQVKHDTVEIPTTVYVEDSVVKIRSGIDTTYSPGNFRALAFESTYNAKEGKASSFLTEDKIGFTATVGLKRNDKKQYEIFVRPHYPDMKVGMLEGAIIEENLFKETKTKIPLVTLGGNIGWTPFTYDLNTQKADINLNRIGVNIGLNFNLSAMLKK